MGKDYGDTNWSMCLADALSGSSPAGNYFYLFGKGYESSIDNDDTVKYLPSNISLWIKLGKGKTFLQLDAKIPTGSMSEENTVCNRAEGWRIAKTHTYAFIILGGVAKTFLDQTASSKGYLKCKIKSFKTRRDHDELKATAQLESAWTV